MTKKISKFEENRQFIEANINEKIVELSDKERSQKSLLRLGAVGAVGHLAQTLSAQTIRALQQIRDNKDFEALGFTRFDDFLDNSEISPMTYDQFNSREKLLAQEGDQLFDLMNSLKISHRQRKLLGAGHVQIDEKNGTVLIVTGEDLEEKVEEIELTDRTRLLQTLSALADQAALLNDKNRKQKEKIEKGEKQVEELKKQVDDLKNRPGDRSVEEVHFDQMMRVVNAIDAMATTVKDMTLVQKLQHSEVYLDAIHGAVGRLEAAYGRKPLMEMTDTERVKHIGKKLKGFSENGSEDNEFAEIVSSIEDEELADLME